MSVVLILGVFVIVVALLIVSQIQASQRRAQNRQAALARGWRVESVNNYSGSTDGFEWRFLTDEGSGEPSGQARWQSTQPILQNEVLAVFASGGRKDITVPTNAPKFAVALAARVMGLAMGTDGVDATLMADAKPVIPPGPGLEAYLFRATRPELMLRVLEYGGADALRRQARRPKNDFLIFSAGHQGTRILLHGYRYAPDRISEIVKLGTTLGAAIVKAQRPA
jgi:hypothetical protein